MRILACLALVLLWAGGAWAGALDELRDPGLARRLGSRLWTEEVRRLVGRAVEEDGVEAVLRAWPSLHREVRRAGAPALLPRLALERPEAVAGVAEGQWPLLALAALVEGAPAESRVAWSRDALLAMGVQLPWEDRAILEEVAGSVEALAAKPAVASELMIQVLCRFDPPLAVEALVVPLSRDYSLRGGLLRGAVVLAVLDTERAAEVLKSSGVHYSEEGDSESLACVPVERVRGADLRRLRGDLRVVAERAVVRRLGLPEGVERARSLEPGRFRVAALVEASRLPGAPSADLRHEAFLAVVEDPEAGLDELSEAVLTLDESDPLAAEALRRAVATADGPAAWTGLGRALERAWSGPLKDPLLRAPGTRFELLPADWIQELDLMVQDLLEREDVGVLESRFASPAARTLLLYRASLASAPAEAARLAARIPAPQERAAAFLALARRTGSAGWLDEAAKAARACPDPAQRSYWLVQVAEADAPRAAALLAEAVDEGFRAVKAGGEHDRWGIRMFLGQALFERYAALEVPFARLFALRPSERAPLLERISSDLKGYWPVRLWAHAVAAEPSLLEPLLARVPRQDRYWVAWSLAEGLLPGHPAEASKLADTLTGSDREEMHALVAVSLGAAGQVERCLGYLERKVPSRFVRSQALRWLALRAEDPVRARFWASRIPLPDARKVTLMDLRRMATP